MNADCSSVNVVATSSPTLVPLRLRSCTWTPAPAGVSGGVSRRTWPVKVPAVISGMSARPRKPPVAFSVPCAKPMREVAASSTRTVAIEPVRPCTTNVPSAPVSVVSVLPPTTVTCAPPTGSKVSDTTRPRTTPPWTVAVIVARSTPAMLALMALVPPVTPSTSKVRSVSPAAKSTNGVTMTRPLEAVRSTRTPPAGAGVPSESVSVFRSPASSTVESGRVTSLRGRAVSVRDAGLLTLPDRSMARASSCSVAPSVTLAGTSIVKLADALVIGGEIDFASLTVKAPRPVSVMRETPDSSVASATTTTWRPGVMSDRPVALTSVIAGGTLSAIDSVTRPASRRLPATSIA